MSKLAATLKEEITRLGRREAKKATARLKQRITALERVVRAQKSAMQQLGRQMQAAASRMERAPAQTEAAASATDGTRMSPGLIRSLRKRLKLSQTDFARLTGVTHVAVYLWESGRTKPRGKRREALIALRGLGVREARQRLEEMGPAASKRAGNGRRKKRAAKKAAPAKRRTAARRGKR